MQQAAGVELTPAHVARLVDSLVQNDESAGAFQALRNGPRYTPVQLDALVETMAKSPLVAAMALDRFTWLTNRQRATLRIVK